MPPCTSYALGWRQSPPPSVLLPRAEQGDNGQPCTKNREQKGPLLHVLQPILKQSLVVVYEKQEFSITLHSGAPSPFADRNHVIQRLYYPPPPPYALPLQDHPNEETLYHF